MDWPAITASGGGWLLFGAAMVALLTGRLVTRREADIYLARAEKAEAHVDVLLQAVAEITAVGRLQKAAIDRALAANSAGDHGEAGDTP